MCTIRGRHLSSYFISLSATRHFLLVGEDNVEDSPLLSSLPLPLCLAPPLLSLFLSLSPLLCPPPIFLPTSLLVPFHSILTFLSPYLLLHFHLTDLPALPPTLPYIAANSCALAFHPIPFLSLSLSELPLLLSRMPAAADEIPSHRASPPLSRLHLFLILSLASSLSPAPCIHHSFPSGALFCLNQELKCCILTQTMPAIQSGPL